MNEFTVVNTFVLKNPEQAAEFERRFADHVRWMRDRDGFGSHQAVRDTGDGAYVNVGWWTSPDAFKAVMASETFQAHAKEFHQLVDVSADPSTGLLRVDGESGPAAATTVAYFDVTGDPAAFEAAYGAYARAAGEGGGLGWLDLAKSLVRPGHYTAITRWTDQEAADRAAAGAAYAAVTATASARTLTTTPVLGTRTPQTAGV